jgi:hypothetical protein
VATRLALKTAPSPRARRHHHPVDVVLLDERVWNEPRFRLANPGFRKGRSLVHVGMTGLDADLCIDKHKAGVQANRKAFEHGLHLLPAPYAVDKPDARRGCSRLGGGTGHRTARSRFRRVAGRSPLAVSSTPLLPPQHRASQTGSAV